MTARIGRNCKEPGVIDEVTVELGGWVSHDVVVLVLTRADVDEGGDLRLVGNVDARMVDLHQRRKR